MRWGLVGLVVALAACGSGDEYEISAQALYCPGVVAGVGPDAEPAQAAALQAAQKPGEGRQRYLIRYRERDSVSAARVSGLGGLVHHAYRSVPVIAARLSAEERALLAEDPAVESIEPDLPRRLLGTTPPPLPPPPPRVKRGSVGEYTQGLHLVEAPWVWDTNRDGALDSSVPTGEGITVCVLDTGIDPEHPELKSAYAGGKDFVDGDDEPWDSTERGWGHGTHVAGIIAAQLSSPGANVSPTMDSQGVVGVAPGVRLLIARVLDGQGLAWSSTIVAGLEWCQQQGAHIASLSLGGPAGNSFERAAFKAAAQSGMLVIAAAGNSGEALDYPAAYPGVLAVGAVDHALRRAHFSARGWGLSLMAPGVDVLSTVIQGVGTISQLEVGDIPYDSRPLYMAPAGKFTARLVDCGDGSTMSSCKNPTCDGFVAYVDLNPSVPLEVQLTHVMRQGALALIVGDAPHEGGLVDLSIGRRGHWVPAALVSHETGLAMRRMAGFTAHVKLHKSDYALASGTSMAAPHVTGAAALVWSTRPDTLTAAQVRELLESTAKDLGAPGRDWDHGYGLVRASAAIQVLQPLK
ncbi:MAG: S8 family serine peptidase [Myxococcaceae bacterium]|nr:S8 family serine peptidase [Myxococcaceae bacterium]